MTAIKTLEDRLPDGGRIPTTAYSESALLKVLAALQEYLPPDGIGANECISKILSIVDPWPVGLSHPAPSTKPADDRIADAGKTNGWQPIETAPKNSKAILVHCAERKNTYTVTWARDDEFPWSGKWKHFAGDFLNEVPTHWMPLPAAPQQGETK